MGYVKKSLIFLSGPTINTVRTVSLSKAVLPSDVPSSKVGNILYSFDTAISVSAIIGKLGLAPAMSLISSSHEDVSSTVSTLKPIVFTFLFANSSASFSTSPSSVEHTGVLYFG